MTLLFSAHHARTASAAALAVGALLTGCGDSSKHASDGDTGAAAPATRVDLTRTPRLGDSTSAVAKPTGKSDAASGDTAGSRVKDSVKGRAAGKPTRP